MADAPIQILEVRAPESHGRVTVTAAVRADAGHAIFIALSEQLDRRRPDLIVSVEDVLGLRRQTELVERFAPVASSRAHAVVAVTDEEFRACLLGLSDYRDRVDGEHFQPAELRERLRLIAEITAVLWEANAAVAAASDDQLSRA